MDRFLKILFVSQGLQNDISALKQAMQLALRKGVSLEALIVAPRLPDSAARLSAKFESFLKAELEQSISQARAELEVTEQQIPVNLALKSEDTAALGIIRHVMRGNYDLVVKAAEPKESNKSNVDFELLRKCPSAVWLCRACEQPLPELQVAVAVDPEATDQARKELSIRLLHVGRSFADLAGSDLTILSCWQYEFERYLRSRVWTGMEESELQEIVRNAQFRLRNGLDELIRESGIAGPNLVHFVNGSAASEIPVISRIRSIGLLVIGTVARSGISGLLIGNTAETIMHEVNCSLLAIKPYGFSSPVQLY